MNRSQFFATVRTSVFGGSLAQSQVNEIEAALPPRENIGRQYRARTYLRGWQMVTISV
ncbi:hypothetical protein MK632_13695 [Rhizobium changzhiense]|uniref:hypothetical protein n=1 Tax=Rhizobium changzhiense TaxID=2692317 RepID=UPI001F0C6FDA|nr:hypothetical protein [Rhizobium changzhiense]MCH4546828.1 hypothetical protein [Rhizobium changzhiense]